MYVRTFPDTGALWQISNKGGAQPVWSRKDHELLYRSGDQIMAASYTVKAGTFAPEKPRIWLVNLGGATAWDLAPDGKRVAALTRVDTPETSKGDHEVVFLFNFFDYLRQRVPLDK